MWSQRHNIPLFISAADYNICQRQTLHSLFLLEITFRLPPSSCRVLSSVFLQISNFIHPSWKLLALQFNDIILLHLVWCNKCEITLYMYLFIQVLFNIVGHWEWKSCLLGNYKVWWQLWHRLTKLIYFQNTEKSKTWIYNGQIHFHG